MSDSVQPLRWQPTRLRRPWDSPGKGCHFLLQCMKVKSESEVAQLCPTLQDSIDCSPRDSSTHRIFQASVLEWVAIAFSASFSTRSQILSIQSFLFGFEQGQRKEERVPEDHLLFFFFNPPPGIEPRSGSESSEC